MNQGSSGKGQQANLLSGPPRAPKNNNLVAARQGHQIEKLEQEKHELQSEIESLNRQLEDVTTFCHRRLDDKNGKWCGKNARFLAWGQYHPVEARMPLCDDCAHELLNPQSLGPGDQGHKGNAIIRLPHEFNQ